MKLKSVEELELYLKTGNCHSIEEKNAPILNPTFYVYSEEKELEEERMGFYILCPFDAFLPVPFKEQQHATFDFESNSAYDYCKYQLQSRVSQLKSRNDRITFYFHGHGDVMKECLYNEAMRDKFHVIFLADRVEGLANLISTLVDSLVTQNPDALLLTELTRWMDFKKPSVLEYLESSLGCPLSMIPTFYGVWLTNHIQLGSILSVFSCTIILSPDPSF